MCFLPSLSYVYGMPSNRKLSNIFLGIFLLMWTIFKVLIEFIIILLLFYILDFGCEALWGLSSLNRDQPTFPELNVKS